MQYVRVCEAERETKRIGSPTIYIPSVTENVNAYWYLCGATFKLYILYENLLPLSCF